MATSIADLLDAAVDTARWTPDSLALHIDATEALRHLARALTVLSSARTPGALRRDTEATTDLARASRAVAGPPGSPGARITALCAAAADAVGVLRDQPQPEWHWAATVAIAETARHLTDIAASSRDETDPKIATLRWATARIEHAAAATPPSQLASQPLHHPIPHNTRTEEAADRITESVADLIHHTRAGTRITVAETLAVTFAAEALCTHAAAAPLDPEPARQAAKSWRAIRTHLQPLRDGSTDRRHPQPALIPLAVALHDELQSPTVRDEPTARAILNACAHLPLLAHQLSERIRDWPATSNVLALAADLPPREDRITQYLAGHRPPGIIRVDQHDLTPTLGALHDAKTAASRLARAQLPPKGPAADHHRSLPTRINGEELNTTNLPLGPPRAGVSEATEDPTPPATHHPTLAHSPAVKGDITSVEHTHNAEYARVCVRGAPRIR